MFVTENCNTNFKNSQFIVWNSINIFCIGISTVKDVNNNLTQPMHTRTHPRSFSKVLNQHTHTHTNTLHKQSHSYSSNCNTHKLAHAFTHRSVFIEWAKDLKGSLFSRNEVALFSAERERRANHITHTEKERSMNNLYVVRRMEIGGLNQQRNIQRIPDTMWKHNFVFLGSRLLYKTIQNTRIYFPVDDVQIKNVCEKRRRNRKYRTTRLVTLVCRMYDVMMMTIEQTENNFQVPSKTSERWHNVLKQQQPSAEEKNNSDTRTLLSRLCRWFVFLLYLVAKQIRTGWYYNKIIL